MSTRSNLQKAASALAMASMLTACASNGGGRIAKASDFREKKVELGLATKALASLNANDFGKAIEYAELAVAQSPKDAGFRTLLGNSYFGAGRFASAEQAYRDSLSLYASQPKVMLKLALVEIALGKSQEALELIDYARAGLDPADYGLALALAGRADDALSVLKVAAGNANSDARVRQNLALAYALSGDWVNARVVAAQDVAPNEIDVRIQQWMEFASPGIRPAARVASLTGVQPVAADPGQPVQLALVAPLDNSNAQAAAEVAPTPAPVAAAPAEAEVAYAPPPPPPYYAPAPAVVAASAPVEVVETAPQQGSITVKLPEAKPVAEAAPAIAAADPLDVGTSPSDAQFPYVDVKPRASLKKASAKPTKLPARKAFAEKAGLPIRKASLKTGNSGVVVQLGAYGNANAVMKAWNKKAKSYAGLASYVPVSARYAGPKGTFYRLSVRGFGNASEANKLCGSIKKSGGSCFVRTAAGDRPVQIASR